MTTNRANQLFVALVSGCLLMTAQAFGKDQKIDWQKTLDSMDWKWSDTEADPLRCAYESTDAKHTIKLALPPVSEGGNLIIEVSAPGEVGYKFTGHSYSVFRIEKGKLIYVDFGPSAPGGTVISIDLASGKEEWRTTIKGIPTRGQFTSSAHFNLDISSDAVIVCGNESAGRYVEAFRLDNGALVGHREFVEK